MPSTSNRVSKNGSETESSRSVEEILDELVEAISESKQPDKEWAAVLNRMRETGCNLTETSLVLPASAFARILDGQSIAPRIEKV